jgi:hypothetical protein
MGFIRQPPLAHGITREPVESLEKSTRSLELGRFRERPFMLPGDKISHRTKQGGGIDFLSGESGRCRSRFFRCGGAARHGTFAALAAVMLHGVFAFAFDYRDLAAAFVARVLGAHREPFLAAFAGRSDMFGISDQDGFAVLALHRDHIVRPDLLGLGEGRDGLGALPVLSTGTRIDERSERAKTGGRE